jgi:hypothetical protein
MRSIRRRLVAIAAATSVVLLGSAAAAQAETLTVHDGRHDVWAGAAADGLAAYQPAPHQRSGDVLMARLRYGPHNLVLTQRFVRLARNGDGDIYGFRLRTETRMHRMIQVQAFRSGWAGSVAMTRPNGRLVACDGLAEDIDYAHDLVRVVLPTSCLRDPSWVQFAALSAHITRDDRWLVDNPHDDQASFRGWSARVRPTAG